MRVSNLNFSYASFNVFQEFSIDLGRDLTIIKGFSGCGKTTLLKSLTNNLRADYKLDFPAPVNSVLILQEDALFPWLTGVENIEIIPGIHVDAITRHVLYPAVSNFIEKLSCEMSFGQRRMIELFRGFVSKPDLLCLDEPFNYLDPDKRGLIADFIVQEYLDGNKNIIMSTHYDSDITMFNDKDVKKYCFDPKQNYPVASLIEL